jgi:hypothetical protein
MGLVLPRRILWGHVGRNPGAGLMRWERGNLAEGRRACWRWSAAILGGQSDARGQQEWRSWPEQVVGVDLGTRKMTRVVFSFCESKRSGRRSRARAPAWHVLYFFMGRVSYHPMEKWTG